MINFSKKIAFNEKNVGIGYPAYFVAEIGANFDNSLDKAKKLCDAAKEAGADCAKFQSFISEKIVAPKGFQKMHLKGVHGSWGRPVNDVFKDAEFPRDWHHLVKEHCDNIGIHFSTSPYDFEAVDLCMELDLPFIKIGSGEITWIESANINVLKTYQNAFDVLTGYSDHSFGDVVILGSIALGGVFVEKHFTLNKFDKGPDHPHSMNLLEFKTMVDRVRQLEKAMGSSKKFVVEEEQETVLVQRRGLYAAKDIPQGKTIEYSDLIELRPALGILPKYKNTIIGRTFKSKIESGEPISWENL